MNSYSLKIIGRSELSDAIDTSKRFNIKGGELECYEVAKRDLQNGDFELIYKAKFTGPIEIEAAGKKILGKDKTRKSKKLRGAIYYLDENEEFYDIFMDKLILNVEEVWRFLKDR